MIFATTSPLISEAVNPSLKHNFTDPEAEPEIIPQQLTQPAAAVAVTDPDAVIVSPVSVQHFDGAAQVFVQAMFAIFTEASRLTFPISAAIP